MGSTTGDPRRGRVKARYVHTQHDTSFIEIHQLHSANLQWGVVTRGYRPQPIWFHLRPVPVRNTAKAGSRGDLPLQCHLKHSRSLPSERHRIMNNAQCSLVPAVPSLWNTHLSISLAILTIHWLLSHFCGISEASPVCLITRGWKNVLGWRPQVPKHGRDVEASSPGPWTPLWALVGACPPTGSAKIDTPG